MTIEAESRGGSFVEDGGPWKVAGMPGVERHLREGSNLGDLLHELQRTLRSMELGYEQQRRLREVTSRANAGVFLDEILQQVYDSFRSLIPYNRIGFALLEAEGRFLRAHWAHSDNKHTRLKVGYTAPMTGSSLQSILETGRPRVIDDLLVYLAAHPGSDSTRLMVEEGIRSSLTCPLVAMGKPVGFLFFSSRSPGAYQSSHIHIFEQIAQQISVIVEKGRIFQELQEINSRLEAEILERMKTEARLRQAQADLEAANRVLSMQASTDGLTGVANRRGFDAMLEREWRRGVRNRAPLAVLLVDVDQFKNYNDTHGHLAGDDALRAIAREISSVAQRGCDLAARYGGEEFALLLPETDRSGAALVAERLRQAVIALQLPHGNSIVSPFVTVSVGVAVCQPTPGLTPELFLTHADRALYEAKRQGRNQVMMAQTALGGERHPEAEVSPVTSSA